MRYLLDTNVLSETQRLRPNPALITWLTAAAPQDLLVCAIVVGEIFRGILKLRATAPVKADRLAVWLDRIEATHAVLPVDGAVARHGAAFRLAHPTRSTDDLLIAATAAAHGLTIATRNTADFQGLGVPLLNPFVP